MSIDIVIRVDGGPEIGYGHLVRSCALADEVLARGHDVTIATTTPHAVEDVCSDRVEAVQLPTRGDAGPFLEWLETVSVDVVFADSYPVDTRYQRAVRERVPLAVLQDDARHAVCADLFVNGNLYAESLDYEFVGEQPDTCLGTDYVLLRSEIRERAVERPPWRQDPEYAIVTMGGSDIRNLTPTIVRAFDGFDIQVDAIVGPGFSEEQERAVRRTATACSVDAKVARDPDDLIERMFQADFAVSTASSTTYELLGLGTPIVSVPVVENQLPIAAALRDWDAATTIEYTDDEDVFARAIQQYVRDPELRRERRDRGRELVDGRGVERTLSKLHSIL